MTNINVLNIFPLIKYISPVLNIFPLLKYYEQDQGLYVGIIDRYPVVS